MALRNREQMKQEHQRLVAQIQEWNANRLDLFELSLPNEELEFHGVMRFFHQDEGAKVSTKCIRVSSTATTRDVLNTLIEKFRPDMRMLSLPEYSLYEVHVNGEERKLEDNERPLLVQLNWGRDDREGRFLLKSHQVKTNLGNFNYGQDLSQTTEPVVPFKRKLSKREKKELKKQEKLAKLKGKENDPGKENVAEKLYNELPETSFTRSISNPEAVMRRRRQLKLEKKLQQFRSKDGGPDSGGTLKIYGESLRPDLPYKTLLLSTTDSAAYVVKETLDKYGLEKENPSNFCLVQVQVPPNGREVDGRAWGKEEVLDDYDCPLAILMQHPPSKGTIMFHLRRRTQDMPKKKKKKGQRMDDMDDTQLPYLVELNPDGSEVYKGRHHRLPLRITEVGSDQGMSTSPQYLQLYGPDIHPLHCVIAHTDGVVTVTPRYREAEVYVGGHRCFETTMLQHGVIVRFGKGNIFRFINPSVEEQMRSPRAVETMQQQVPPPYSRNGAGEPMQTANFETTFDVDGHVEAKEGIQGPGGEGRIGSPVYQPDLMLPATLEFREDGEDAFLASVVSEVNGAAVQFKLAPVYTLYMAARYRISKLYRPDISPQERAHRLTSLVRKVAHMVQQTVQENRDQAGALSFWMANASELLHFLKQDTDISRFSVDAQDILAEAVQVAFRYLISCIQLELRNTMPSFLIDTDDDINEDDEMLQQRYPRGQMPLLGDVLQILSSTMSLLRKCRVNAALTIQLFSQLFHYINMWLFNRLVLEPHLQLCTRQWGQRLRRRLNRIEQWAEKQGLELAANCHLARIIQAAHLLEAPKSGPDHIASISSTCFKLNSLQLRRLLQNYRSAPNEPTIPPDLIDSVVKVAENTADELTRSDGRDVQLEEEPDLQLPFLLPEDGYSCDIIRGVPNGLAEFLDPLSQTGLCRLTLHGSGSWTVYMSNVDDENLRGMHLTADGGPGYPDVPKEPEEITIHLVKVHGSMGLSIVAAKGENQDKRGIYIKSVVPGGAAALDGRLRAGDQLLEVDGRNLVGLTQEKAAELMTKTGQTVTLRVAKQGAVYHGLADLLSQPSPIMQRSAAVAPSPTRRSAGPGPNKMMRPKSEDVSRFNESPGPSVSVGLRMNNSRDFPGQQGMYGAGSTPALTGARSHDNLQREDPYASFRGSGGPHGHPPPHHQPGPQSHMPQSASYYSIQDQQHRDPAREQALRSKSTSQLDRHEPSDAPYRQAMSTSTLPHSYPNQPHHVPQQPLQQKFPSQPDLQHRSGEGRTNYENYPGQQRPQFDDPYNRDRYEQPHYMNHAELRSQFTREQQMNADMRGTQSMGNLRGEPEPQRPDTLPLHRPKSEEFDRVHEWQQRNEMERRRFQQQQLGPGPYNQPPQQQQPPPLSGYGSPDAHRPTPNEDQPPQGQHPYYNRVPQPQQQRGDSSPPYADVRRPEMEQPQRQAPDMVAKPQVAPKPAMKQDNRQSQMYDLRQQQQLQQQQQQQGPYQGYPPPNQGYPPGTQVSHSALSQSRQEGAHPIYSRPDPKQHQPVHQQQAPYGRRNQSPDDLPPPPPDVPPPPLENDRPPDELPPPPPVNVNPDYERQIQEEQEKMMRRLAGTGADRISPQGQDSYDPRYKGYQPDRPAPQNQIPQYHQQQKTPATHFNQSAGGQNNFSNYQNLPGQQPRGLPPSSFESAQPKPPYPYSPRQESQEPSKSATTPTRPPVAQKPRFVIKTSDLQKPNSPWEREQKEQEKKRKEEEAKARLDTEVNELERKPYLTPEEQDRLSKLRLEQEFQRRVQEMESKGEDGDDSDTDITERASGRAKMIGMIREDLERTRKSLISDRTQREREQDSRELEKIERQERRIQMFEKEREEQRQREYRRQEKRERETEEYLKKQRELREQARRQQEESLRQQRLEDERRREREREELRKRREREREQMREMQAAREEEERAKREAARIQEEEAVRQRMMERQQEREREKQEERYRFEKYGHLGYNDPAYIKPQQGPSDVGRLNSYPPPVQQGDSGRPGQYVPPPPERNSSYDVATQLPGYRTQSASHLPNTSAAGPVGGDPSGPPPLRSASSTGLRATPAPVDSLGIYGAKKSVSFDSNLTTEIQSHPYPSTSSETSSLGFHPMDGNESVPSNAGPAGSVQNPTFIYTRGSSSGSSVSEAPGQQYFQRGSYSTTTPNTPVSNEVFDSYRTPENQGINHQTLVVTSTPGVVGAQEIYRDPRDRIARQKADSLTPKAPIPERMSFRDKMKMFANEIGENTPVERPKISKAQREIETSLNGNGR